MLKLFVACAICLLIAACGSSKPSSPLILGDGADQAVPGPRTLSLTQQEKLQAAIVGAGAPCSGIYGTYLRDVSVELKTESWDVRCGDDDYSVQIMADGPAAVHPCRRTRSMYASPCFRPDVSPRSAPTRLNPDLGKLLEPMTAPSGKND